MSKIIGIDLGTTNSCVSILEAGEHLIIPNSEGQKTTPSVVTFEEDNSVVVGELAKRQILLKQDRTVSSIKRKMGSTDKINILGKEYLPEEISAQILKKLKKDAEEYIGEEISDAIITVPAYFDDSQRQATKNAGLIAGLNVLRIINEPTSAALSYGLNEEKSNNILIYDLGGGTFDISILEFSNGLFQVLATSGDNMLGGDDFDSLLVDYISNDFYSKHKINLKENKASYQRLKDASENAKIELSYKEQVKISIPFIHQDENGVKNLDMILTRIEFENLINPLITKTIHLLKETIFDSGIKSSEIDKVLLVGGSTKIPLVKEMIYEITKKEPYSDINPDECVAAGAAIQGGIISGDISNLILLDVTPLSLGIETVGGIFTKLIERNTTIPTRKTEVFSTAKDNQSKVEIHILQGERNLAKDNKSLGKFTLENIPKEPKGIPQIEVKFDIDVNGIVNVSAKDLLTGNKNKITIKSSNNVTEDEINKAILEANKNKEEDLMKTEYVEIKNKIRKSLENYKDISIYKEQIEEEKVMIMESLVNEIKINEKDNIYKAEKLMNELNKEIESSRLKINFSTN